MCTSKRPYFVRCWYDWMCDNDLTPHVVVNSTTPYVQVPKECIKDGKIVLNIDPEAVEELSITTHNICFKADFDSPAGISQIILPMKSIVAIYAEENKQGMFFADTSDLDDFAQRDPPKFTVAD